MTITCHVQKGYVQVVSQPSVRTLAINTNKNKQINLFGQNKNSHEVKIQK